MKSVDGSIEFVPSGSSYYESTGGWVEWNRKVLTALFPGKKDGVRAEEGAIDAIAPPSGFSI